MSELLKFVKGLDSQDNLPTQEAKEKLGGIESEIKQEQKTILYLAYLTTLARLPKNRDLDELFDGEIQLGEEEMFSIYSLIEIINGSNSFTNLKAPKKMKLDWNYDQDYDKDQNISGLIFERPANGISGGSLGVDQEIKFKREDGLVTELETSKMI